MQLLALIHVNRQGWNILLSALLCVLSAASADAGEEVIGFEKQRVLRAEGLQEISGLVRSPSRSGGFWALNDSGNPAELIALDNGGAVLSFIPVPNAINLDWEDLTAFQDAAQSWLVVGDIGDNLSWRSHLSLYLVPEPDPQAVNAPASREIRFQFADGPRDCESLAVDLPNRRFLMLDKGRTPVGLYALPMDGPEELRTAFRLADLPELAPQKAALVEPLGARWRGSPTAMDLSADGRRMLILTYTHLLLFERREDEDWPQALQRPPLRRARLPAMDGFESAALSADGRSAWIINEGRPAVLYRWTGITAP